MSNSPPSQMSFEALEYHRSPQPGKLSITPIKPMATQRDLSLAYSPGVAAPVLQIAEDQDKAYDFTSKGNTVAVVSNGTAILGLGDLGAMASKPVMEGKAVLFKRFADIDSIDLELQTRDPQAFIDAVDQFGRSFGGINLEDIKSPECFEIESALRDRLDVPVFHDDQHGTAIIAAAAFINGCEVTSRDIENTKVVVAGAGAAGLSVARLLLKLGVAAGNLILTDEDGVLFEGRPAGVNKYQAAFVVHTDRHTLEQALVEADCLLGLSAKGAVSKEMVKRMAASPLLFVLANPDPEISPEDIRSVRPDAIIATGRSDYSNQVNNVLGFPYIFRGALDVRAKMINEEMKLAAVHALASLAREDVPDEVAAAYGGRRLAFGPDYLIPTPFDPRLISYVPPYVAAAAMKSGVARKPIQDMDAYRKKLTQRLDPSAHFQQGIAERVLALQPKTIVFAEGEEPSVARAAYSFQAEGLGRSILIGREEKVERVLKEAGAPVGQIEIVNTLISDKNSEYTEYLYGRLRRQGYLRRDAQRLINTDRNVFASCMVARGDADGIVSGVTRSYESVLQDVRLVIDERDEEPVISISVIIGKHHTLFVADTNVNKFPDAKCLAAIGKRAADFAARLGHVPRVAFLSYSDFGSTVSEQSQVVRGAVEFLDEEKCSGFEYDGEMSVQVALNAEMHSAFPFSRLSGPANVLVMPTIHSAAISTSLISCLGAAKVLGPFLVGLNGSAQIARLGAHVSELVKLATFAAFDSGADDEG